MLRFIKDKNALVYCLSKKISEIVIPENENFDSYETIATGTSPVLSPDGNTVYFVGSGKDNQGIYSIPRTGGARKRLTDLLPIGSYTNLSYFTLSPDGSTIAFFTKKDAESFELCLLSADGKKIHKSVNVKSSEFIGWSRTIVPDWSPDSKMVAYAYGRDLYTIPAWSSKAEKLAELESGVQWDIGLKMKWSPDGRYIASFVINLDDDDEGYYNDIVIVSTQNGEVKRLTSKEEHQDKETLSWHPESKKLAYFYYDPKNDDDGIREAYVDGRPTTEMIDQPDVWDYWGTWHPNGIDYYFWGTSQDQNATGWQLYKFNAVSKEVIFLPFISDHVLPGFSKDGKHMVLTRIGTETQLWMMEGVE